MEWKTADALLETEEQDDLYSFLREVGLQFGMTVEQVMANTTITFEDEGSPKNSAEKTQGAANPVSDPIRET